MTQHAKQRKLVLFLGAVVLTGALLPPLHELAEHFFWAHMLQHELIVVVAAPLIAMALPTATMIGMLPPRMRNAITGALHLRGVPEMISYALRPVVATVAHAMALVVWHLPLLYDRAVESTVFHAAQHASFLITGLMFWSAMLSPRRRATTLATPVGLFAMAFITGGIGALLVLAPQPLFAVYVRAAGSAAAALQDQQIAGYIMWMPGTLVYCAAALWVMSSLLITPDKSPARIRAATGVRDQRLVEDARALKP